MEKLIVNFNRKPKSLKDKKTIVALLERQGVNFTWENEEKSSTSWCPKCGAMSYNNDDCDNCIRNTVGEVYYD